jgi:hypothetical protein
MTGIGRKILQKFNLFIHTDSKTPLRKMSLAWDMPRETPGTITCAARRAQHLPGNRAVYPREKRMPLPVTWLKFLLLLMALNC